MSNLTREDILEALPERYTIDNILEQGGCGQVVKCLTKDSGQAVAVKLPFYEQDTEKEIALLEELMEERMDQRNIVRFIEAFDTRLGRAMVFELLDMSLWGLVDNYYPLPLSDIFSIVQQVATALDVLRERSMVHSDLKMGNVMVVNHTQRPLHVKLIDFGSTIPASETGRLSTVHHEMYRPPEVILGSGWDEGLDVWCLGVIMSHLWLGFNLFPNVEYEALRVMHKLLGPPPEHILNKGSNTMKFYYPGDYGWDLRVNIVSLQPYAESFASLRDLVMDVMGEDENREPAIDNREPAIDLLEKLLDMDMNNRITPKQILKHPAICHEKRSETNKAELQEAPATSPRVIMVKPASPENIIELQEVDVVQKERILMSREKAPKTCDVIQQKDRRSETNKAELQEAPATSPRVIMVKPASPENIIELQEVDVVQKERILMSREKAPKTCDVIQQKDRRSETNKAELQEAPATSPRVIMVKPASPENIIELQEVDVVQKERILMSREKAPKTCDVIQQKDRRSETNKAELQEAPATSPRVIMVKPASPENIIELQEVDVVQKESHKVLMSREKAHRTFNVTQQKNRRSGSSRAEVQEAPVSSHRVIMVKSALPENTIRMQEGDHGKSVTSVELHSAERTTQIDPIQDQQQSDSRLNMETKAKDREPALIQTPTSTRCDAVDERLEDRPKRKFWIKRTAKVQPLNDSTLPPTEDDFVPKKKRKNIFRRAFSLLKRCSCFN
ncbi:unnamed protein product [Knipowitschia caucasica]|uniref:Protein kinase domain-containing protein n=1 Tax=Knipowitschia caucasica TaxID=637954 RepID=A0AAV2KJS5_KNICA